MRTFLFPLSSFLYEQKAEYDPGAPRFGNAAKGARHQ
jgi:hypothetical protein